MAVIGSVDPAAYEAWYYTRRGRWIGEREATLLLELIKPARGQSLLDVGSGTGYFSRRFAAGGLAVTGIDPDPAMLDYARTLSGPVEYLVGRAERLPFADNSFDYVAAVTSLCFINTPEAALQEMWRVSRRGIALGLLNRHSLLYLRKGGRGGYAGARWDTWSELARWITRLRPPAAAPKHKTAILWPKGGMLAQSLDAPMGAVLPWGGFLAAYIPRRL